MGREHELSMLRIESATAEDQCFKEAEIALVSADTLNLNMLRAMQELQIGYAEFMNALEQAHLALLRGIGNIADAEESGVQGLKPDPWLNRDLIEYERSMRLGRRAAYLAVRAVEYEFQQSLDERSAVLEAEHPDELVQLLVVGRRARHGSADRDMTVDGDGGCAGVVHLPGELAVGRHGETGLTGRAQRLDAVGALGPGEPDPFAPTRRSTGVADARVRRTLVADEDDPRRARRGSHRRGCGRVLELFGLIGRRIDPDAIALQGGQRL